MLLYSTLLCKKIARAPGGHKKFVLTKLGGGGGQNRSQETIEQDKQLKISGLSHYSPSAKKLTTHHGKLTLIGGGGGYRLSHH